MNSEKLFEFLNSAEIAYNNNVQDDNKPLQTNLKLKVHQLIIYQNITTFNSLKILLEHYIFLKEDL